MKLVYRVVIVSLIVIILVGLTSLVNRGEPEAETCDKEAEYTNFEHPERVTIQGYDDDAMEPFLSRDGQLLFFNNSNDPAVDTNLHWARRIDDLIFEYMGEIGGTATESLEGVATMDNEGNFYFVSTRSYDTTFSTLYTGKFDEGLLTNVGLLPGVSRQQPGWVNFDVEVSADGNHLYFVDSRFIRSGQPQTADLVIAERHDDVFERLANSADLMAMVNTDVLEYAAAISADERELFFTRVDFENAAVESPKIYRAFRDNVDEPFGCPERVVAIDGFVEAATFSPDEYALYYHKLESERFVIYRVTRSSR